MVTTDRLRQLFDYCNETGALKRKVSISRSSKVGEAIGCKHPAGYVHASVDRKVYPLHHLVWIWHGKTHTKFLDHIDRNPSNNRIENLRAVTHAQNMWNKSVQKNNSTGASGVSWHKTKGKYQVRIGANGSRIHLGYFDDFDLAELVSIEARAKYHGAFAAFL